MHNDSFGYCPSFGDFESDFMLEPDHREGHVSLSVQEHRAPAELRLDCFAVLVNVWRGIIGCSFMFHQDHLEGFDAKEDPSARVATSCVTRALPDTVGT